MINWKERAGRVQMEDLRHPANQNMALGEWNLPGQFIHKTSIPTKMLRRERRALNAWCRFHKLDKKHVFFVFACIERYDRCVFLKGENTEHRISNYVVIPKDRNLYFGDNHSERYSHFRELIEVYGITYDDMMKFVAFARSSPLFTVIDGSHKDGRCTTVSYNGFDKDPFNTEIHKIKNKKERAIRLLASYILRNLHEAGRYEIESFNSRAKQSVTVKNCDDPVLAIKLHNESVDFKKMNKPLKAADEYFGLQNFFAYTRKFREDGTTGGRVYNVLTSCLTATAREEFFNSCGLVSFDLTSAQMQMMRYYMFDIPMGDDDIYLEVFNRIKFSRDMSKFYPLLRPFVKLGCSVLMSTSPQHVYSVVSGAFEDRGLCYSDTETEARRACARNLWQQEHVTNPYKTGTYMTCLSSLKAERMQRREDYIRKNPDMRELIEELADSVPQKVLKQLAFGLEEAFFDYFVLGKAAVDKIRGKTELAESNAMMRTIVSCKYAIFGVHDCVVASKDTKVNITKAFLQNYENEVKRQKYGLITKSFEKVYNFKKCKFITTTKNLINRVGPLLSLYYTLAGRQVCLLQ